MFDHMSVQRSRLDKMQELCESLAGDAFAPIFLSEPVTNLTFAQLLKANDVSSDVSIEENGLDQNRLIYQDLAPMHHERLPVSGWKGRHSNGIWVQLLLKENGKVCFLRIPELNVVDHKHLGQNYTPLPLDPPDRKQNRLSQTWESRLRVNMLQIVTFNTQPAKQFCPVYAWLQASHVPFGFRVAAGSWKHEE